MFLLATPLSLPTIPSAFIVAIPVIVGATAIIDSIDLTILAGAKWLVTIKSPDNDKTRMFEISAIVGSGNKTHLNMFGNIGDAIHIDIDLNILGTYLNLKFTNHEEYPIIVDSIRLTTTAVV